MAGSPWPAEGNNELAVEFWPSLLLLSWRPLRLEQLLHTRLGRDLFSRQ